MGRIIEELRAIPIDKQFEKDITSWEATFAISGTTENVKQQQDNEKRNAVKQQQDNEERNALLKKIFLLIQQGIEIDSGDGFAPPLPGIPFAAYLSHGSRILFDIDASVKENFLSWLELNDLGINQQAKSAGTGKEALQRNKQIFNRPGSSHEIEYHKKGVIEKKGLGYAIKAVVSSTLTGELTNHWGMNIALGGFNKRNKYQQQIKPNGLFGHLYIHYDSKKAAKEKERFAMLVGLEQTEYGVGKNAFGQEHSLLGRSGKVNATGGLYWDDVRFHIQYIANYGINPPQKYNGMRIKITKGFLENVTKKSFSPEILSANPINAKAIPPTQQRYIAPLSLVKKYLATLPAKFRKSHKKPIDFILSHLAAYANNRSADNGDKLLPLYLIMDCISSNNLDDLNVIKTMVNNEIARVTLKIRKHPESKKANKDDFDKGASNNRGTNKSPALTAMTSKALQALRILAANREFFSAPFLNQKEFAAWSKKRKDRKEGCYLNIMCQGSTAIAFTKQEGEAFEQNKAVYRLFKKDNNWQLIRYENKK